MTTKLLLGGAFALVLAAAPAAAQETAADPIVYRREIFQYQRAARPDPFRSLLLSADLGVRFEDLSLNGVVYDSNPERSVAILSVAGSTRRVRVRTGDRLGGVTIVAIRPREVQLLVDEFGVARRESLQLKKSDPAQGT